MKQSCCILVVVQGKEAPLCFEKIATNVGFVAKAQEKNMRAPRLLWPINFGFVPTTQEEVVDRLKILTCCKSKSKTPSNFTLATFINLLDWASKLSIEA